LVILYLIVFEQPCLLVLQLVTVNEVIVVLSEEFELHFGLSQGVEVGLNSQQPGEVKFVVVVELEHQGQVGDEDGAPGLLTEADLVGFHGPEHLRGCDQQHVRVQVEAALEVFDHPQYLVKRILLHDLLLGLLRVQLHETALVEEVLAVDIALINVVLKHLAYEATYLLSIISVLEHILGGCLFEILIK